MVAVKLYVEGGGDAGLLHQQLGKGFERFFISARMKGRMPRIFASGSRQDAFQDFKTAIKKRKRDELPLLLVDSEHPVASGASVWKHLEQCDGWNRPEGADDNQAFLMVQCMETWFIADREALINFFGKGFNPKKIPQWRNLEAIEKTEIFKALASATARCEHKQYQKGKVSFELLGWIDPAKVEDASTHARDLLDKLRGKK